MTILGEKLAEIEAALEIGQTALIELHKENEELQEECKSLHGQLQDCGRRYEHTKTDRDEWKRRALEAEEAGQFLLDRLSEFELSDDADEMTTEYLGHVSPAEERLRIVLNSINSDQKGTHD